jgi:hypothetical protein
MSARLITWALLSALALVAVAPVRADETAAEPLAITAGGIASICRPSAT